MKLASTLAAGALAVGTLSGCAGALIAADAAVALYEYRYGTGEIAAIDVGLTMEDCEKEAKNLNVLARHTGTEDVYSCLIVDEDTEVGPVTETEVDVIMGD